MANQIAGGSTKAGGFGGWDYIKITVLGFAFAALWQSLHTLILPIRLLDFVGEADKNTALGIITFTGLLLAMFVQPIAGALSDRSGFRWGRRRPYILIGAAAATLFLPGIGLFGNFAAIFLIYSLLQLSTNIAQGPFQGFIPEMVPEGKRGLASGVKTLLEIVGGAAAILLISQLMSRYEAGDGASWLWLSLGIIMVIVVGATIAVLLTVKEKPATGGIKAPLFKTLFGAFKLDLKKDRPFMWFLASRLMIFMAFATLQQFSLYFLRDSIGVEEPAKAAANFTIIAVIGMLIAVYPAGRLSDRIGRKPIALASGFLGALAILIIIISGSYEVALVGAGIIGIAVGAFSSTNWAMATDLLCKGEEARYLGIANMATAGGAALARLIGPVIDFFEKVELGLGYQVMLIACFVYFTAGALLVLKIKRCN